MLSGPDGLYSNNDLFLPNTGETSDQRLETRDAAGQTDPRGGRWGLQTRAGQQPPEEGGVRASRKGGAERGRTPTGEERAPRVQRSGSPPRQTAHGGRGRGGTWLQRTCPARRKERKRRKGRRRRTGRSRRRRKGRKGKGRTRRRWINTGWIWYRQEV